MPNVEEYNESQAIAGSKRFILSECQMSLRRKYSPRAWHVGLLIPLVSPQVSWMFSRRERSAADGRGLQLVRFRSILIHLLST
jgi:hypothetical protein